MRDDGPGDVSLYFRQGRLHHRERVAADGVHLRVELKARDAVAQVDQRRASVLLDYAGSFFNGLQDDYARLLRHGRVLALREVEVELAPAFGLVERGRAGVEHLLNVGRSEERRV